MAREHYGIPSLAAHIPVNKYIKGRSTHSRPCPCRAHAFPLQCRAANGLECVFLIGFTQCGRV